MDSLVSIIDGNTAKILLVILTGFSLYVIKEFKSNLDRLLENHSSKIELTNNKFSKDITAIRRSMLNLGARLDDTKRDIEHHSVKIRKDLMGFHLEIKKEINSIEVEAAKISSSVKFISNTSKLGENNHGKIILLEGRVGKNKKELGGVVKVLNTFKDEYGKIKKSVSKNEAQVKRNSFTVDKVESIFKKAKRENS